MFYQKFSPSNTLNSLVMCYYVWEHNNPSGNFIEVTSPPNGFGGMVFNYGEPYSVKGINGLWEEVPQSFLAGQFTSNYTLRLSGNQGMIGIVFWPAGLSGLLNTPMPVFNNQRIDLNLVLGIQVSSLENKIMDCRTHYQRVAVLDQFLLGKVTDISRKIDVVNQAFHTIWQYKGIISIRKLSDEIFLSPRQFRRRFTEKVGISPKLYARIKRFNYISSMSSKKSLNLMDMVYMGGYYDQAHFIKDISCFSGKRPTDYLSYTRKLAALFEA